MGLFFLQGCFTSLNREKHEVNEKRENPALGNAGLSKLTETPDHQVYMIRWFGVSLRRILFWGFLTQITPHRNYTFHH